ncbi:hypothetical protein ISF6_5219 [Piscinibacter sakaiensis]|uniref:Uncharacterized protein n=1 Tax=Piscinibacter sakaiensis TaxID=1547922 RepID=A0A0K8P7R7_PISS1|nr:hypothetical protein ISF6_5219 [Piscinibacter sakaiensis]
MGVGIPRDGVLEGGLRAPPSASLAAAMVRRTTAMGPGAAGGFAGRFVASGGDLKAGLKGPSWAAPRPARSGGPADSATCAWPALNATAMGYRVRSSVLSSGCRGQVLSLASSLSTTFRAVTMAMP